MKNESGFFCKVVLKNNISNTIKQKNYFYLNL